VHGVGVESQFQQLGPGVSLDRYRSSRDLLVIEP
jgi:hypothetical protein